MVVEGPADVAPEYASQRVSVDDVEGIAGAVRAAIRRIHEDGPPAVVVCDGSSEGEGGNDPIRRELWRLACNGATRELIAPMRSEVGAIVMDAERRARLLRSGFRRGRVEARA
jgi:hypothetical protein